MSEAWNPFAAGPEVERRIAIILGERYAGLAGDVKDRIGRSPNAETRFEVRDGGWVHFWVDVGDGGGDVELGELSRAALTEKSPGQN
jgi:hypothetical protein